MLSRVWKGYWQRAALGRSLSGSVAYGEKLLTYSSGGWSSVRKSEGKMATVRYAVYRYSMYDSDEGLVPHDTHYDIFKSIKGLKAPYRVRDVQEHDLTNFIFDLEESQRGVTSYFKFGVGYQITSRMERQLDPRSEKIRQVFIDANDMRFTRGIFIPELGVCGFRDGSGDNISATGGAGRVQAIFETYSEFYPDFEFTASQQDLERAVHRLKLIEMKFEVRPFNPHPSIPGMELHALLEKAKVGKLTATARPHEGGAMIDESGGLVSEVQGMSNKAYGQYGITAKTEEGATVTYKKKTLTGDRDKDQATQEKPKQLHISVEKGESEAENEIRLVGALVEMYAK